MKLIVFRPAFARISASVSLLVLLAVACHKQAPETGANAQQSGSSSNVAPVPIVAPINFQRYTYEVVNTYPHDRGAFTEGLFWLNGALYESTGLNGRSSLRKVDLTTGHVLQQTNLAEQYFGEGLVTLNHKLYQLTYTNHVARVYDLDTFQFEKEFPWLHEGWGLTTDGQSLITSDGSDQIRFLDPATFEVRRSITVTLGPRSIPQINELEYIKGEIFANVWKTDFVVRIDPTSGHITGVINFTGLLAPADHDANTDVMNGIAYDEANDRLFVTGKCWSKLFEVRLKPAQ